MDKKRILITGISGFIGRNVARALLSGDHQLTGIVRPGTDSARIEEFTQKVEFIEVDLAETTALREQLAPREFDIILHMGALRGGRKFDTEAYYKTNVLATEELLKLAQEWNSSFIFCSSVGVFGAIPRDVPATNSTPKQADTFYHQTKIEAEALVQAYVKEGLMAVIVRPAITYGMGDYGFPYTLVKMIDKKIFLLPAKPVTIHLTHIDILSLVFKRLCESSFEPGKTYIVADKSPVKLLDLVNFISQQLHGVDYSPYKVVPSFFFDMGIWMAKLIKSDLWKSRFELISKSWYYHTDEVYREFKIAPVETIPAFQIVTDWYKEIN
ncbi:MAG: hypothetical protein Kow0042_25380 [Calditrichia bacterium]